MWKTTNFNLWKLYIELFPKIELNNKKYDIFYCFLRTKLSYKILFLFFEINL
jgi:hypothetical protein